MNSMKKILLGGAAALALAAPASADLVAAGGTGGTPPEADTVLSGATGQLVYSGVVGPGDVEIEGANQGGTDFNGDGSGPADVLFTQGNQITLTLSNGTFASLPTNSIAVGGGNTPTLNFVVNGGGVGASFVTFEVDNDNILDDDVINFDDFEVAAGSYTSADGDQITLTISDVAGELTDNIDNTTVAQDDNLTEVLFVFGNGTSAVFSPETTTEIDVDQEAELWDIVGTTDTTTRATIGDLNWDDGLALDGGGNPVLVDEADVTVTGPFSAGIDTIFLRNVTNGPNPDCFSAAFSGASDVAGTVVGNVATFPTLDRTDIDTDTDNDLTDDDYDICVEATGTDVLLSGQYSGEAVITTDEATTETYGDDIDDVEYTNGEIFDVSYFFGDGGGYAAFLNVVTGSSAGPVIILSREDDGDLQSGLLDVQQAANTSTLYAAGDVDAALIANGGTTQYTDETTRGGLQVIVPTDSFVGSVILNPTNDLGSINTYQPRN